MSALRRGNGYIATGMAFDAEENLYVGDRSGTVFKIARDRQIYVFATLEPSVSAYHLAFQLHRHTVYHRSNHFELQLRLCGRCARRQYAVIFYRGLGRPRGALL